MTADNDGFSDIIVLEQPARRAWLREWLVRMGLANANQAAAVLCLDRRTVERMVYDNQVNPVRITNAVLKLAWALEQLRLTNRV